MIRAFVAIDVESVDVVNRVVELQKEVLKLGLDIKFVEKENLHFTLRFLGEIPESRVDNVMRALANLKFNKFTIFLQGLGVFPDLSRPRVLWIGVSQGVEELKKLAKVVREAVDKYAAQVEREEFVPHLTIGRVKSSRNIDRLREFIQQNKMVKLGSMEVDRVKLKKSLLTPQRPIYSDLFVLPLT